LSTYTTLCRSTDEAHAEREDAQRQDDDGDGDSRVDPELRGEEPDEGVVHVERPGAVCEEDIVEAGEELFPTDDGEHGEDGEEDECQDRSRAEAAADPAAAATALVEAEHDDPDRTDDSDECEDADEGLHVCHVRD